MSSVGKPQAAQACTPHFALQIFCVSIVKAKQRQLVRGVCFVWDITSHWKFSGVVCGLLRCSLSNHFKVIASNVISEVTCLNFYTTELGGNEQKCNNHYAIMDDVTSILDLYLFRTFKRSSNKHNKLNEEVDITHVRQQIHTAPWLG